MGIFSHHDHSWRHGKITVAHTGEMELKFPFRVHEAEVEFIDQDEPCNPCNPTQPDDIHIRIHSHWWRRGSVVIISWHVHHTRYAMWAVRG